MGPHRMTERKVPMRKWLYQLFWVPFRPDSQEKSYLERKLTQSDGEFEVTVAVPTDREADRIFGVPLTRRNMQPVWIHLRNKGKESYRLRLAAIDPNYFPPLEAAYLNHFGVGKRLLAFGFLAWVFFILIPLLPLKLIGAMRANRKMNAFFQEHGLGWGIIRPGIDVSGFVFTTHDQGTKQVFIRLLGDQSQREYVFSIPVPGFHGDYGKKDLALPPSEGDTINTDMAQLRDHLMKLPRATTNKSGTTEGDPLNLVVIGDFTTVRTGFGARWDETETISIASCLRTAKSFLFGKEYRYSPISALYYHQRSQDFSLQRARQTIDQRLHLRLWRTPLLLNKQPVWIGQISRDIGVRFTLKAWNLTTHKIDPDVDDGRDYLMDDLLESGRVSLVGYVAGVGEASHENPRKNLTGDTYYTDGFRALIQFSQEKTKATIVNWV